MDTPGRRLRFGDFELDLDARRLRRAGQVVRLQPQPFRVLAVLAERRGEIVSRDELRRRIWDDATFVEFDQGLNYCIRQIRLALRDEASRPRYIETVKGQGYRFVADVAAAEPVSADVPHVAAPPSDPATRGIESDPPPPARVRRGAGPAAVTLGSAGLVVALLASGIWLYPRSHAAGAGREAPVLEMHPVTDFADSALAPALSPDGRMVAFIRGGSDFLTPDQIYLKMLPDGESRRLTNDPRLKYGPAFSPDGTEVTYTVMDNSGWSTDAVSVLGGEPHLVLANAAGLTWLDSHAVLFSQTRRGQHMGIVTASDTREHPRELYFPAHERAMAHYSFASPDRQSALVVEMDERPVWLPCRLIGLNGQVRSRPVGPPGSCTSAGWSPDGRWMYLGAAGHLWRQAYPDGVPEQLTFGPESETGVAVDPDGRSLLTSVGLDSSTIWLHDGGRDRALSSEGQVVASQGAISDPAFSADGRSVYYLLRRASQGDGLELRRLSVAGGEGEPLLPGVPVREYDVSPDETRLVYTTALADGTTQLWIAPLDRRASPRLIASDVNSPHFGPDGGILFRYTEGRFNYLGRMNADGSARRRVVPYPISTIQSVSPGRHWVMAIAPLLDESTVAPMAIPVGGGPPVRMCEISATCRGRRPARSSSSRSRSRRCPAGAARWRFRSAPERRCRRFRLSAFARSRRPRSCPARVRSTPPGSFPVPAPTRTSTSGRAFTGTCFAWCCRRTTDAPCPWGARSSRPNAWPVRASCTAPFGRGFVPDLVEDEELRKTIIPSRKATKQYLGEESDDEDGG